MQVIDSELKVNDIVEGVISRIMPYGLIVMLPNKKQGLVHISQVSHQFIKDINEHFNLNDIVTVKVLTLDIPNNKISLSIKDAQPNIVTKPEPKATKTTPKYDDTKLKSGSNAFEDIMSGWLKDSNEKQAALNKRAKRRY